MPHYRYLRAVFQLNYFKEHFEEARINKSPPDTPLCSIKIHGVQSMDTNVTVRDIGLTSDNELIN